MSQNDNPQIGTFETDVVVRVPLLAYNNNKPIPLHEVFQGTHQIEKPYVQRRYGYSPMLMPKNKDGKYDISSSPTRYPQKTRIAIPILLEDDDFRNRVFEKIKQNAAQMPSEQAFAIDTLDINNIQVRPVYNFKFTNFDHDGKVYRLFTSETRNYLANTQGQYSVTLYVEVDNADAEYILRSPENIIIKCQYELNFVQQDRNRTSENMGDIAKPSISANIDTINNTYTIIFNNYDYTPPKAPPSNPTNYTETLKSDVTIDMIQVEGGTFQMGGQDDEVQDSEKPVHTVTVDSFYIGKYPVTQAQWVAVMGHNPSYFKSDNLPVEQVSWDDAVEFCQRLSDLTKKEYRLPTEAEWEYAARGGNKSRGCKYAGSSDINLVAWYEQKGGATTYSVGRKNANELGLYDMSGNVWEWCNDWYAADYYKNSPKENPSGPKLGSNRVLRGGGWDDGHQCCRVAYRGYIYPTSRSQIFGFRLVSVFVP